MNDEAPVEPIAVPGAGAQLRAGREAAGLTIDTVAQQLKLAPRQVIALEEDDHAALPGRTFVRGFARNYARLVQLDPDAIVAALPGTATTTPLEHPTLAPMPQPMGEMPSESGGASHVGRNLVIGVVALIAVGALGYEYLRGGSLFHRDAPATGNASNAAPATAPAASAPATASGVATTALPNPLDGARNDAAPPAGGERVDPVMGPASNVPAAPSLPPAEPAAPASTTPAPAPGAPGKGAANPAKGAAATPGVAVAALTGAVPVVAAGAAPAAAPASAPAGPASALPKLDVNFVGTSWVEVKDARGNVVLSITGTAGSSQSVNAAPPLDVVVGNARSVNLTYRGQSVDLAPHVRQNVARLSLR